MPRRHPEIGLLQASIVSDDSNYYFHEDNEDGTTPTVNVVKKSSFATHNDSAHHGNNGGGGSRSAPRPAATSSPLEELNDDDDGDGQEDAYDGYAGLVRHRKQESSQGVVSNTGAHFRLSAEQRKQEQHESQRLSRINRRSGVRSPTALMSPKSRKPPANNNSANHFIPHSVSKGFKSMLQYISSNFGPQCDNKGLPAKKKRLPTDGSAAYYTRFDLIASRPKTIADRLLYRYNRQPLLKGYLIFLICVELLVIFNFAVRRQPAHIACSWLTKGYPDGAGIPSPIGDASFIAMFMCLIVPRVLLYLFYEHIAVSGLAAAVHTAEIFHFWKLGAIKTRADNLGWVAEQYVVFGIIIMNSGIFILHFLKISRFYFGRISREEQSAFEELALSSTESLQEALRRKDRWRRQREADVVSVQRAEGASKRALPSPEEPLSRRKIRPNTNNELHKSNFSPASPTELYIRPQRPLSKVAYKRIQRIRSLTQKVGILAWNLLSAIALFEVLMTLYSALPYASPDSIDPFYYRSLHTEDASQIVTFVTGYAALACLITSFLPWFRKTNLSSSPSPSFFEDSEDEEAFHFLATDPIHKKGFIVASRLPVALIGITAQMFVLYPLRSAAIHVLKLTLEGDNFSPSSTYRKVGLSSSIFSSIFNTYLFVPFFDTFTFFSVSSYFVTSVLYGFSALYTIGYVLVQLAGTGLLTPVWVKLLDWLL